MRAQKLKSTHNNRYLLYRVPRSTQPYRMGRTRQMANAMDQQPTCWLSGNSCTFMSLTARAASLVIAMAIFILFRNQSMSRAQTTQNPVIHARKPKQQCNGATQHLRSVILATGNETGRRPLKPA